MHSVFMLFSQPVREFDTEIRRNTLAVGMVGIEIRLGLLIHWFLLTIKARHSAEWFHYRHFLKHPVYRHALSEYTASKLISLLVWYVWLTIHWSFLPSKHHTQKWDWSAIKTQESSAKHFVVWRLFTWPVGDLTVMAYVVHYARHMHLILFLVL